MRDQAGQSSDADVAWARQMLDATEALDRLRKGNARFLAGRDDNGGSRHRGGQPSALIGPSPSKLTPPDNFPDGTVPQQEPFAIVLGCSDARVPLEMVFDQGLGDLFVIRVAGNIVGPTQIGSIEFAAEKFGTRLVVVMGHSHCGAVAATLEALQKPGCVASPNLASIVDHISPAIEQLAANPDGLDAATLQQEAMRANIHASVTQLHHGSVVLESLAQNDGLQIVGAEYSIEAGAVTFLPPNAL